ncbi:MAG: hypothetical protein QW548_00755 [Candidatus Aenigmatarchaeota archaeon]
MPEQSRVLCSNSFRISERKIRIKEFKPQRAELQLVEDAGSSGKVYRIVAQLSECPSPSPVYRGSSELATNSKRDARSLYRDAIESMRKGDYIVHVSYVKGAHIELG